MTTPDTGFTGDDLRDVCHALKLAFATEMLNVGKAARTRTDTGLDEIGGAASRDFASGVMWLSAILRHQAEHGLTQEQVLETLDTTLDEIQRVNEIQ